ncbi:mechanosensitive ion channel [Luteimonas sp. 8-5]|uniref:mechanosensitive ion channel family protein n=1 Tax=Luteimonas sp. 8-5 TaxID=3039387 RepID=UPI0024365F3D|nr:mechanosensitive ion channel domain-containing protein [Luteimonas sp. 8-5]MDG6348319.1 mechanosensitive ion channel [Luteimonas sp. 8-5]
MGTRLAAAMADAQDKLFRLVAAIPLLLLAIAIVFLAWWLGRRIGRRRLRWLPAHSDNPYLDGLLRRVAQAIVVILGLVLALNLLGATALVGAVLGSAGVVGLVLGFAFKDVAENYIAGVLLSLRRPFAPGDHLLVDQYEGKVIAVTARTTLLMTLDGNQLSLPNGLVFRSVVTNFTANPKRRFDFALPVDPGESLSRARDLGLTAMAKVEGVLEDPAPSWSADGYNLKGIDLRFFGWIDQRHNDVGKVRSEALRAVRGAFARAGVRGPETVRYREEDKQVGHEDAAVDTSVNTDIDAQLAAAQRASDKDLLTPPSTPAP